MSFSKPTGQDDPAFFAAHTQVRQLVETFLKHPHDYSEAQARIDFIDKFWIALGWDVNHERQKNPYEQEVKVERGVAVSGRARRADYAFLAPNFRDVRFFVEAKRPGAGIETPDDCFQVVRYGWNSHVPLSVLTDFQSFLVLDCRFRPDIDSATSCVIPDLKLHCTQYADPELFARIYYLFSRQAVSGGALDRYAEMLPKPKGKAIQRGLFPSSRLQDIDDSFLEELEQFREAFAKSFKKKNQRLGSDDLTEVTQRTLDRLVFMRFLEDKLIETEPLVESFGTHGPAWRDFIVASRRLDKIYNGIIFKEHSLLDAASFKVDEEVFEAVRERLAHTNSPYAFNYIPIHILGSIYERFLGNTILATDKQARVEPKPEVRKAGGVYYTPEYVVRYIVENTVGKIIAAKSPQEIAELRFADIACGSGSFLLGVYDRLLRRITAYYNESEKKRRAGKMAGCTEGNDGKLHLNLRQKREILVSNVYGVDLDQQAVEVAQLSLYLKLLEEETAGTVRHYQLEFGEQLLPDLKQNIVCGNSLVGWDILDGKLFETEEEKRLKARDFKDLFPAVMSGGGFDAIVGNPPYVRPHNLSPIVKEYFWKHYSTFVKKSDLYCSFIERALQVLRPGGTLGYIVSNGWLRLDSFEALRKLLISETSVSTVIDFTDYVFENASVRTCIVILEKTVRPKNAVMVATTAATSTLSQLPFSRIQQSTFAAAYKSIFDLSINPAAESVKQKMKTLGRPLGDTFELSFGIKTGDDSKFLSFSRASRDHKPLLRGENVHRYQSAFEGEYVWYVPSKMTAHRKTARPGSRDRFEQPKILIRDTGAGLEGTFDGDNYYVKDVLIVEDPTKSAPRLKYLLAILNSRLMRFYYETSFPTLHVQRDELASLPIRLRTQLIPQLATLVDKRLNAERSLRDAVADRDRQHLQYKSVALDRQIDQLVYGLYELTPEEVALVEGRESTSA